MRTLLLGAALLAGLAAPARADDAKCQLTMLSEMDIQYDRAQGATVPVTIAGKEKRLLVDTGGAFSMLTGAAVFDLGLPRDKAALGTALIDGTTIGHVATARDIKLGRLSIDKFVFLEMPDDMIPPEVSGVIGPDIMKGFDVELDFASAKFRLFSQDHCPGSVVYWTRDGAARLPFDTDRTTHMLLTAKLDGKDVRMLADTGASATLMSFTKAERLFGIKPDDPLLKPEPRRTLNGEQTYTYPFKALDLDGLVVRNPDVVLYADRLNGIDKDDMILGMTVLRKLHLYVAYKEKALYVTAGSAPKP